MPADPTENEPFDPSQMREPDSFRMVYAALNQQISGKPLELLQAMRAALLANRKPSKELSAFLECLDGEIALRRAGQ